MEDPNLRFNAVLVPIATHAAPVKQGLTFWGRLRASGPRLICLALVCLVLPSGCVRGRFSDTVTPSRALYLWHAYAAIYNIAYLGDGRIPRLTPGQLKVLVVRRANMLQPLAETFASRGEVIAMNSVEAGKLLEREKRKKAVILVADLMPNTDRTYSVVLLSGQMVKVSAIGLRDNFNAVIR
jgi:hypothetical protein